MKKLFTACVALSALSLATGCEPTDNTGTPDGGGTPSDVVEVRDAITEDTTWEAEKTYVLKQHVFVKSGTLTIEPGTVVKGEAGSSLVITTGAKLNAVGTAEAPIVFTSAVEEGAREAGNWGGVVLLGKAKVNVTGGEEAIEGISDDGQGLTNYGGTDDAHDCGKLKYARIEFAGFELSKDNELNGLSVGACGSATELDFIQVHKGADDGVEFFGGTAGIKHLVVTGPDDDGLDWDLGWRGNVQYLVIQQHAGLGNYAFESDSNGDDYEAEPRSMPTIWNATLIGRPSGGSAKSIGMLLREGTAGRLNNFIITGFGDGAVDIADISTAAQFSEGNLAFRNTFFWDIKGSNETLPHLMNGNKDESGKTIDDTKANFVEASILNVDNKVAMRDPQLPADATNALAPKFQPNPDSPARDAANAATPGVGFDASATFVGAVGAEDWTAGWTAFPEN